MDDGVDEWYWSNEAHKYFDWLISKVSEPRCPKCQRTFEDCKCVG